MEKMDMEFELTKQQLMWKQETYQNLLKNEHVKAWLKKYKQENIFVFEHVGKFKDWIEQVEKCDGCQGLAVCRQSIKGQYMDLYLQDILDFGLHRCSYYKDYMQSLEHGVYYVEPKLSEAQLHIDLMKLNITKESLDYKASLNKVIDVMLNEHPEKGLYLWGKPGVGKSYLAAGITNFYAKKQMRCAFINVPTLINDLKMLFHDSDASRAKLLQLRNVPVLVLDDIGGESVTAWSRDEVILPLLDSRMEQKKLTFFTSNYSLEDLKERLTTTSNKVSEPMAAERVLERIRTLACEDFVKGESRRK